MYAYFDGKKDQPTAIEKKKRNTRVFSRNQMTWFRRDPSITWFTPDDGAKIMAYIDKRLSK